MPRLAAVLVMSLSIGCASVPATTAPPSAGPPAATSAAPHAENALARRFCDALHSLPAQRRQECCPASPPTSLAEVCTSELSAALARGSVSLDAGAVDRCAAAMARQLEGCDWVRPASPSVPAECTALLHGALVAGGTCVSSLECADGLFCRGAAAGRNGVCAPPAPPRSPCAAPYDNLATFAGGRGDARHGECDGRCFKGQCYPVAEVGEECISSAFCRSGLTCTDGRCADRPPAKLGEACTKLAGCVAGAFCKDEGICVPLKGAGEACASLFECRGLRCDKAAGASTGLCGDPCGSLEINPPKSTGAP